MLQYKKCFNIPLIRSTFEKLQDIPLHFQNEKKNYKTKIMKKEKNGLNEIID